MTTSSSIKLSKFPHLLSCKLLRVTYSDPGDWEMVPRMAPAIRLLHMESSPAMNDDVIEDLLDAGAMRDLEVWTY